MGKKNKNLFSSASSYDSGGKKGKKKDKDKKRNKYAKKIRTMNPEISIDKSDRNKMKKLAERPIEVPEENQKIRNACNHQTKILTVDQFDELGYCRNIVPMLDAMISVFGKNNIGICSACYDIVVLNNAMSLDDARKALCVLYGVANYVVMNRDVKRGEIKGIAQTKNGLMDDWLNIVNMYREVITEDTAPRDADESDDDARLNMTNAVYAR